MVLSTEALQARLSELAEKHNVVGATVGVLRDGDVVSAATGVANRTTGFPATLDTVFQIGSITKVYTATLVMQLVDEGTVDLDAPVRTYLTDLRLGDAAATKTVTVRQLLAHTSGLEGDHFEDFGRGDDGIARYVASCAELPQLFEPGRMNSYSNAGWVILGRLVEVLRDKPFRVAMAEHLLAPAGLQDSPQGPDEAILRHAAVGHVPDPSQPGRLVAAPVYGINPSSAPAGSMQCATVADLLRFAELHLRGGKGPDGTQVLSGESVTAMQQPQVQIPDPYTLGEAWGLGWILTTWDGRRVIGHDGGTIGQSAFLRVLPDDGFAIGLLTNGGDTRALYDALFRELFAQEAGVQMPVLPQPLEHADHIDLDRYAGRYERLGVTADLVRDGASLVMKVRVTGPLASLVPPTPDKTLLIASDELFFIPPDDPNGTLTPLVFFDFDDDGRPQWAHFGARAARRTAAAPS